MSTKGNVSIEFELKAKNCKCGQLFWPASVVSTLWRQKKKNNEHDGRPIIYLMDTVMTADVTQIQMSNWSMSHGKRVTVKQQRISCLCRNYDK